MSIVIYLLKVSLGILVFYLLYRFLFSRYTFFRFNRYFLLGGMILSLLLPWIHLQQPVEVAAVQDYSLGINWEGALAVDVGSSESPEQAKAFNLLQNLIEEGHISAGHDVSAGGLVTTLMEMSFSNTNGGMEVDITGIPGETFQVLFSEKPAVVIQVDQPHVVTGLLEKEGILHHIIGRPLEGREMVLRSKEETLKLDIDHYRDLWFRTSYLLDRKQSGDKLAEERYKNYKNNPLEFHLKKFKGSFSSLGVDPARRSESGVKAAIIREKGVNGDREMAYAMHLAGFDVKDVHMTDLISGRETLEDISFIVFVGGFSNSDVLGSAKGWAGAFRYNEKARIALENYYKRDDTLSLGVCNGCQLMAELNLINPEHEIPPALEHNSSGKFESNFISVEVRENDSVMLKSLSGYKLGIWVAHGEGRFELPYEESKYNIPVKYKQDTYPANPNGSIYNTAALCSEDGRHLAIMPHLERAYMPWQCAYYPEERKDDEVTPWIEAFVNARKWVEDKA